MLKFLGLLVFLIPLIFKRWSWWLVQGVLFFMSGGLLLYVVLGIDYSGISYFFGVDSMGLGLILLSSWICALMITASSSVYFHGFYFNFFLALIVFLLIMLFCTFSSLSYFSFYFFFEGSLIPTLFLILGWGYQPERLQAGIYLMFYTLFASLPLLVGLFYIYSFYGSLYMGMTIDLGDSSLILFLSLIFAFLIKMPMFLVHLWLPSAHVEAPVSGSMILAGVLLKLGGYGLLRVYIMLQGLGSKLNFLFMSVSLVGGMLISILCLRQSDLSALIAYSSVAHMGLVLGGIMTMNNWGISSSYSMMLAHGLCSSGMFCLANITYERMGSRSLLINKGLMSFMPSMTLWWFLLCSCNMAAPPSLNLMGEIGLLNSMVGWSWMSMISLMLMSFFSAAYSLYLYSISQHGHIYSGVQACCGGQVREYLVLIMHWLPLNLLVLSGELWICWL
nr:NADH dehydrogenase subunit 4 [Callimenellus fumidus]